MITFIALALTAIGLPKPVTGDFDHDRRTDRTKITKVAPNRYELEIIRSSPGHPRFIVADFTKQQLLDLYLDKVSFGNWRTWCATGADGDEVQCPRKIVHIRYDTLVFGFREASTSIAWWNGRRFEVILISN